MAYYAYNTSVPVEQTRNDIESTLKRYGASSFAYGYDEARYVITFKAHGKIIRITLEKPRGRMNESKLAKEDRRRWRALLLVVKAKLEAIASGIATFDNEFLPYVVMSNGKTIGDWAAPQLEKIITGQMPLMLGDGT